MPSIRRAAPALCAVLALVGSASLPGSASAELASPSGIQEYVNKAQAQAETTATATTATSTSETGSSSSSISGSLVILALVAGGLLLGGIAFVIVRDARSAAPVVEGSPAVDPRSAEERLRKRRAKAKAARQQRKRNR